MLKSAPFSLFASFVVLSLSACSSAPPASSSTASAPAPSNSMNWWERDPVFLAKNAVDFKKAVPPPPEKGSTRDLKEMMEVLKLQSTRSASDCERAKGEAWPTLSALFGPQFGLLTEEEVSKWAPLMEKVSIDTEYVVKNVKAHWKRERPFMANSLVKPCIPHEKSNSYPSGHGAISMVIAETLSDLDPARRAQFEKRAAQVAYDRVVAGVHYWSDVDVGARLGKRVYRLLSKNAAFRQELNAHKTKPPAELPKP